MALSLEEMDEEVRLHLEVLGWCVKQRRLGCHLSQEQLAELAHVSRAEVQHVEHARHSIGEATKLRLCMALGISVVELEAEVDRVKHEWTKNGRPPDSEDASITGGAVRRLL